ncbi:hypothetical protein NQ176_g7139 [Zarea fungicola]|uniref:Uncharacterized protein n=1 Tax=Zarea fungicola TaxID=93591 RepID=A0ACC1MZL2_9HYPO|nr:hypothetical protein NQ176_g7139 [Lecanicillium fungicola]
MADASPDPKNAWTDEARLQFLLRVVAQLQRNGQSIKWNEINMPGRTPKSLQHQWAKIKALVAELEKASGQPATPPKAKGRGAVAKRKATDDGSLTQKTTPQKKRLRTPTPDNSPVKIEDSASDGDED